MCRRVAPCVPIQPRRFAPTELREGTALTRDAVGQEHSGKRFLIRAQLGEGVVLTRGDEDLIVNHEQLGCDAVQLPGLRRRLDASSSSETAELADV